MIYSCLPSGPTEANIEISLSPDGGGIPAREYFAAYHIRGYGRGLAALRRGVRETAEKRFRITPDDEGGRKWEELLAVACRCRIRDRRTGKAYSELRPRSVFDILRRDPPSRGRARAIKGFSRRNLDGWSRPVFISARALRSMGIEIGDGHCQMLDGARRLVAYALQHRSEFGVELLMTRDEHAELGDDRESGRSLPPVDLLLITRDRRRYLEKTLAALFSDPAPFRLYLWDNASRDGSAAVISGLDEPRVAEKRLAPANAGQGAPFLWFLERSRGDLVGKIDDDILLPTGWLDRLAPLLRREGRLGLLGCWTFMPEDWDEGLASPKVVEIGGDRIFQNLWIGGAAWLGRGEHVRRFLKSPEDDYGTPVDQFMMTAAGLINGWPLPPLFAHHMDDPRSPHCLMGSDASSSSTAARKGISSPREYAEWIAADARRILREPLEKQIKRYRLRRDRSVKGRLKRLLLKAGGRRL